MTTCSLKDSNLQPNLSRLVGLERKSLQAQELERWLSVPESRTAPETSTHNGNASVTRALTPVYRVEHRVSSVGPLWEAAIPLHPDPTVPTMPDTRFLSRNRHDGWCDRMMQKDAKSAFRSSEALLCYFWLSLADLHTRGYLAALYMAPVLREDHTGQCLIPVDAVPLRRVPLLDLALLAGEGG